MADRLAALTGRMDRTAQALALTGPSGQRVVDTITEPVGAGIDTVAAAVFGTDRRSWSGVPAATVTTNAKRSKGQARITLELTPGRAWQYGQKGARRHKIAAPQGRVRGRVRVLGGGLRHPTSSPIEHPGTAGQRAITRAHRSARQTTIPAARRAVLAEVKAARRG